MTQVTGYGQRLQHDFPHIVFVANYLIFSAIISKAHLLIIAQISFAGKNLLTSIYMDIFLFIH